MPSPTDLDLSSKDIAELASPDAIAAFLSKLGYDTARRTTLTPEAVGLSGDSAAALRRIEVLAEDSEEFLRVVFAQPKSLTAKVRTDLTRVLGKSNVDHLLILASDFDTLEFVLLDKRKREQRGPGDSERIQVVPKTISVSRRAPTRLDLRALRRFTWTGHDALEQFDKLRSVFDAAAYTGEYFQNRGLFSDYYLRERGSLSTRCWRQAKPLQAVHLPGGPHTAARRAVRPHRPDAATGRRAVGWCSQDAPVEIVPRRRRSVPAEGRPP